MKRSKQRTLFQFDVFAKTKKRNGKARIPSLLVVRMSNVAISDEMAPSHRHWRFTASGLLNP